jgi:hypothetical protein
VVQSHAATAPTLADMGITKRVCGEVFELAAPDGAEISRVPSDGRRSCPYDAPTT